MLNNSDSGQESATFLSTFHDINMKKESVPGEATLAMAHKLSGYAMYNEIVHYPERETLDIIDIRCLERVDRGEWA